MTNDTIGNTIDKLVRAGRLAEYPELAAEHERRKALEGAATMASLDLEEARRQRDEAAQASAPRDLYLPATPPFGKRADFVLSRRRGHTLGTVRIGDDAHLTTVILQGMFGWVSPAQRRALEPHLINLIQCGDLGLSRPGVPHDDLHALISSAGYGRELAVQGRSFLETLFAGADLFQAGMAGLVTRWVVSAEAQGQHALGSELRRLCSLRGHTVDDVLAQRASTGARMVTIWPKWEPPVAEDEAAQ
jgi:hypothetical protein